MIVIAASPTILPEKSIPPVQPDLTRPNSGRAPALVEIKGASEAGDLVAEIAREVPLRQIAYSKYCVGVLDGLNISSV